MSGDITSAIINGAAQGYAQGVSRRNAQNASQWSRDYNDLVDKYNALMDKYNDLNKRFHRMGELYKEG